MQSYYNVSYNRAGKIRHTVVSCTYRVPEVVLRRMKYRVPKIFISSYQCLRCKFRSSAVIDKQKASLNITSVHLSAFLDFVNIFIRYRSKQRTSELPLMATEMVSITVYKEVILTQQKSQ